MLGYNEQFFSETVLNILNNLSIMLFTRLKLCYCTLNQCMFKLKLQREKNIANANYAINIPGLED